MTKKLILILILLGTLCLYGAVLPGRPGSSDIQFVQFGSTDVFFYMTPEKYMLTKKIVEEINQEKIKLTVDINDYDCLTTELSAIASKYPYPIDYIEGTPIFADPAGHATLESYAQSLHRLMNARLGLKMEGISREINFVLSQDAHKFHQDQSANQFLFLKDRDPLLPRCKIVQDLTLVDWDMSLDTFSATIIQDSVSKERFLLALFPKETVGMIFTQSPVYLTREAHPGYSVPTIFPYHAVLSPIDRTAAKTPGSAKGKRLSTVLRGVALESDLADLREKATELSLNRPVPFEDESGGGLIYPNGIVAREIDMGTNRDPFKEGWFYKHPDRENVEIFEVSSPEVLAIGKAIAKQFGISYRSLPKFIRLVKKDSGFSRLDLMNLKFGSHLVILNSSELPERYDYFNLAQDFTPEMLPWIQLYHLPPNKAFLVPVDVASKLSLTPIEEILFRKPNMDSMRTDGIFSYEKIVTKIDLIIFNE